MKKWVKIPIILKKVPNYSLYIERSDRTLLWQ